MLKTRVVHALAVAIGIFGSSLGFGAVSGVGEPTITHNTPKFTATAKNLGVVDPSTVIEVSIWLNPHNKADMDTVAKDLYEPASPNYRQWLTKSEFLSKYAPTEAESKTIQEFFISNNLKIVSVGPGNFYVRAKGTAAQISNAFHVSLNNYEVNGKTVRANASDPVISGPAASLVASVAGLDSMEYTHPLITKPTNLPTPKSSPGPEFSPLVSPTTLPFNPVCISTTKRSETLTDGSLPTATYTGNGYTNASAGCGYTPENIQEAYNLTGLYKEGYDGKGQTIVIIDWCGSPTITSDANAFSAQFGLPALTSANFSIINTAPSFCASPDPEINIDVEWAHAIAPGAAIDLVVPPSASFDDVNEGVLYAVVSQLGGVISGSYASEESETPETILATEDLINEAAALLGISANFSSGDDGDYTFDFPGIFSPSVSAPADSPHATGVGGISLRLAANNSIIRQIGWGTNLNLLSSESEVSDPPTNGFFYGGSGGGPSTFFAKPSFQHKLASATSRQVPDVSWLADPYTGAYIAISEPFAIPELQYQVYGGTSLACPMFSALWAIANQEAGHSLGQAAPYLYSLPSAAITDIVPVTSATNVTGTVVDSFGATTYTAADLAAPLEGTTEFASALWNYPLYEDTVYLITFGTDSGLVITPGYDNVTGLGVPAGKAFADNFHP